MQPEKRHFHSSSLRKGRRSEPGRIYLVTASAHDRKPVFRDLPAARILVGSLRFLEERDRARTIAYVIMPDHLHWLVQIPNREQLSSLVRSLKGYSGRRIRLDLGGTGKIWQSGFHDRAMRRDENLKQAARYVIANPLRAGLVDRIEDYPHWDAEWL